MKLIKVEGRLLATSNADFERKCLFYLTEEQEKINPDNGLVDVLCEAVRCVREYSDRMDNPYESKLQSLEEENQKLKEGLSKTMKHLEIVTPTGYKMSGTWNILNDLLKEIN